MGDLAKWFPEVDAVRDEIIALNQALVRIPSVNAGSMPTGNETEVCEYVRRWLAEDEIAEYRRELPLLGASLTTNYSPASISASFLRHSPGSSRNPTTTGAVTSILRRNLMQALIRTLKPRTLKSWRMIFPLLALLLVLAVACGTSTTPDTTAPDTTAPDTTAPDTTAPEVASVPTAVPEAKAEPAAPAADVEVHPGKLTWMIGNFGHERFDPTYGSSEGHDYGRLVHAFLISSEVQDGRRVSVPGIVTKWEVSSDGLTWIYTIREGVQFNDGTEVTVEDVLWSLQHTTGPESKEFVVSPSYKAFLMDRIEQTGPDQISSITTEPISDFPLSDAEASGNWRGIVLPKRETLHDVELDAAYDRDPIGAGIFKLVKHVPSDSMTFERFDDYYHQPKNGYSTDLRPKFTTLDLRLVPEEATRVAAMRAGEADIAPITMSSKKQVEAGGGRVVFGEEAAYFRVLQMGCMKPQFPCHDLRVRQALNYAIDKELMRDTLYGGPSVMQVKGWSSISPSTIGYSPELDPVSYDPDKARSLLAEAGYKTPDNPSGKDFGELIINTYVSPSLPLMPEAAQLVAEFWKRELGVDAEVRVGDQSALKKSCRLTEDCYGQILFRDNETKVDGVGSIRSVYGYRPDRFDIVHDDQELFDLVQQALTVFEPVAREQALNSTYRRIREEHYHVGLGYMNVPWAVGPRVLTWEPYPLAFYPSAIHTITLK